MDADTRDGSLRTQRCLPTEFHTEVPTLTYRETRPTPLIVVSPTQWFPKSRSRIVVALLSANSRFFTDCYPISAVLTPKPDPNPTPKGATGGRSHAVPSSHLIFKFQWLGLTSDAGRPTKTKGPDLSIGTLLGRQDCNKLQLTCRRRKAGISRWSSPCGAGATAAGRPWMSNPCGACRGAYSDTGE